MKVAWKWWGLGAVLLGSGLNTAAQARSVAIGGVTQAPAVDSRTLGGTEMLAVWTLPRLGISVRNDPSDVRLLYGQRELHYDPLGGWHAAGNANSVTLPPPQLLNGSLYVPLSALRWLGVQVQAETPVLLTFGVPASVPSTTLPPSGAASAAPVTANRPAPIQARPAAAPTTPPVQATAPVPAVPAQLAPSQAVPSQATPSQTAPGPVALSGPASPPPFPTTPVPTAPNPATPSPSVPNPAPTIQPARPVANLSTIRISRTVHRNIEVRRVVLELSAPAAQTITRQKSSLGILLGSVTASPVNQPLPSGEALTVTPSVAGATVQLPTGGGVSEIFTLNNPARVVVDTTTLLNDKVPPPIDPDSLPQGVTYLNRGTLHLLSFDPALYQARVVTAPSGRASDIASLVRSVRGVAGVNGGYFDTSSQLPVDLIVKNGLMTAPSLERRATVGFTPAGEALFGYPRPRYVLSGSFGSVTVNTVSDKVRRDLLSAFVGDGATAVGADDLTTLYLSLGAGTVQNALTGRVVPPAGTLAVTFDPARFPQLPRSAGQPLTSSLTWRTTDAPWDAVQDALSAGPLLVQGGRVVINPQREKFDTFAGIWRPTRQVAVGTLSGKPVLAYFEYGTPEAFAAALAGAGVRDAVRMDSGSSASVYSTSGFANLGGYLNTVWSQRVPNAIVFVPRNSAARRK